MMMSGTDRWVASVQWLALIGIGLAVFSGARILDFGRQPSAFAACLFVLLPQPLMQSTTTQNDLIESFFVVSTAFFAIRGLRDRSLGDMTIAALALAMAAGTKGTAFIAASALLVLVVAAVIAYRPPVSFIAVAAVQAVLALIALTLYNYVLNIHNRGSLLGGLQSATAVHWRACPQCAARARHVCRLARLGRRMARWVFGSAAGHVAAVLAPSLGTFTVDFSIQEDTAPSVSSASCFCPVSLCWSWPAAGRTAAGGCSPPR